MKISEIVAAQRRRLGLKQYQLADRTGIAPSQISIFERGSSGMVTTNLEKVLQALDLHIVYDRTTAQDDVAKEIAATLHEKGKTDLHAMTQEEIAYYADNDELLLMPVVSEELYRRYTRCRLIDETNTWNYFKRLIQEYLYEITDKETMRARKQE